MTLSFRLKFLVILHLLFSSVCFADGNLCSQLFGDSTIKRAGTIWRFTRAVVQGTTGYDIGSGESVPMMNIRLVPRFKFDASLRKPIGLKEGLAINEDGFVVNRIETVPDRMPLIINSTYKPSLKPRNIHIALESQKNLADDSSVLFFLQDFLSSVFQNSDEISAQIRSEILQEQQRASKDAFLVKVLLPSLGDLDIGGLLGFSILDDLYNGGTPNPDIANFLEFKKYLGSLPGRASVKRQISERVQRAWDAVTRGRQTAAVARQFYVDVAIPEGITVTIRFDLVLQYVFDETGRITPAGISGFAYTEDDRVVPTPGQVQVQLSVSAGNQRYDAGLQNLIDGIYAAFFNLASL